MLFSIKLLDKLFLKIYYNSVILPYSYWPSMIPKIYSYVLKNCHKNYAYNDNLLIFNF